MPERPVLEIPLSAPVPCQITRPLQTHDEEGTCYTIWSPDFDLIRLWYLGIERELKTACLASGGTPNQCRTP